MTSRLPSPGQDNGTWGDILNDFLSQSLSSSGSLNPNTVGPSQIQSGAVNATKLSATSPSNGQVLSYNGTDLAWSTPSGSGSVPNATGSTPGLIQLTGDLGGTATAPTVPGLSSKEPAVTIGTTSQYYRGDKTFQTLDKTAVGLTNVDNTSDSNKPISSATQTALNAKATTSSLSTVATSGSYADLSSKPTIPTVIDATTGAKGVVQLAGDLAGTAALPTVAKVNGVSVTGTAASGTALVATSSSAATWTASVTLDTTDIPQPLGSASPGTGTNGAAPNDHVHAMPALSQLSDQDISTLADGTIPTWNVAAGKFKQQVPTLSAASQPLWLTLTSGMVTLPRTYQADSGSFSSTPATGVEHFTYFRADKSMTVGHIQFQTGGTAAASSTYAAVGLYTVTAGTLTLVASCANKTTFTGTYAAQSCAMTAGYAVTSGTIYAVGILQVATTTASLLGAWYNGAYLNSAPALAGTKSAQATLATSTSGLSNQQFPIYYELLA